MDKKLTDNDIKNNIIWCMNPNNACADCPYYELRKSMDCVASLFTDTLDYINRLEKKFKFAENINHLQMEEIQNLKEKNNVLAYELGNSLQDTENKQAEIERLNSLIAETNKQRGAVIHAITRIDEVKTEAYKEFAERLKTKKAQYNADNFYVIHYIPFKEVDNTLKEMVGE